MLIPRSFSSPKLYPSGRDYNVNNRYACKYRAAVEILVTTRNIVATANLKTPLDLQRIAQTVRNAEYNPTRFQAVIMRIHEPRTTALIFHSGKMVVTGAKSDDEVNKAARKYTSIIQKVGFPAHFTEFETQNMTATCDVGFPIRLESFLYKHVEHCTYEPELFPGLIYRMLKPKVVLLIFASGKVVITGAKKKEHLYTGIETIFGSLFELQKKNIDFNSMTQQPSHSSST